ncbi:MAG: tRNA epoxyqueuosine(34) reductase QueG [Clostridiaceae bacterium]
MNFKKEIIEYANSLGLSEIGFVKCEIFEQSKDYLLKRKEYNLENPYEEKSIEKRINPFNYMEGGKTIITVAFPYFKGEHKDEIYFSKYTLGMDYHLIVKKYLDDISSFINGLGFEARSFCDNNSLMERYIALKGGLGFIGKNNMIINRKYGSYIFLGEILTDIELEPNTEVENKCGDCTLCQDVCPTNSLKENNSLKCLSYVSQNKNIKDQDFMNFKGRLFGCDSCQDCCPFNKNPEISNLSDFDQFDYMKCVELDELVNLDNNTFRKKYKITASGWLGKNILIRNALINSFYYKRDFKNINFNSPYVKNYYDRLLKYFEL